MAEVTISEEQLATFNRGLALLQKLSSDPSTKRDFERVVKKIAPEIETTDDIIAEGARPYVEQIEALTEKLTGFMTAADKREQEAADRAADATLNERFARLRSKEGLTDEGEVKVREIMVERNIPDPEAAFALFERNSPKPQSEVANWEPDSWNIGTNAVAEDQDVKGLFANEDSWADRQVSNVLREMRAKDQI